MLGPVCGIARRASCPAGIATFTRPSPSLQDWKMSMPMHLMTLATPPAFMAMAGYLGAMLGEMLIKVRKL